MTDSVSVRQYVLVSSPLRDLWPDITFCPKVVVWKLLSCLCGTLSLTRGWVCHLSFSKQLVKNGRFSTLSPSWTSTFCNRTAGLFPFRTNLELWMLENLLRILRRAISSVARKRPIQDNTHNIVHLHPVAHRYFTVFNTCHFLKTLHVSASIGHPQVLKNCLLRKLLILGIHAPSSLCLPCACSLLFSCVLVTLLSDLNIGKPHNDGTMKSESETTHIINARRLPRAGFESKIPVSEKALYRAATAIGKPCWDWRHWSGRKRLLTASYVQGT
jgi:hypothetical protein